MEEKRKITEDERKRYKITCPQCGKVQYACKSIFHNLGYPILGHGKCLGCGQLMRLAYMEESDTMEALIWEPLQAYKEDGTDESGISQGE